MRRSRLTHWLKKTSEFILFFVVSHPALASTSGTLPFSSKLETLKNEISGPWLLSVSVIMIVVTCLALAFGEFGEGIKKFINIVMWLSIAFGAASLVMNYFGGGAII